MKILMRTNSVALRLMAQVDAQNGNLKMDFYLLSPAKCIFEPLQEVRSGADSRRNHAGHLDLVTPPGGCVSTTKDWDLPCGWRVSALFRNC